MPESGSQDGRLAELQQRWQYDTSTRAFLPLVEEYRRLGRSEEALKVLEKVLEHNPGYLSALVARGRCLLDVGRVEEALGSLEEVMERDPTHLAASKLLVEAHLRRGDAVQARRRLEIYEGISPFDPEAESLRERILGLQLAEVIPDAAAIPAPSLPELPVPTPPVPTPLVPEPPVPEAASPPPKTIAPPWADPPALPALTMKIPAVKPRERGPASPAPPASPVPPTPLATPAPPPPAREAPPAMSVPDPFADLGRPGDRDLYLAALGQEGLFPLALEPKIRAAEILPGLDEEGSTEAVGAPAEAEPEAWTVTPQEEAAEPVPAEPVPAESVPAEPVPGREEPPGATVTMGELYLRQGHLAEAERIFRLVLAQNPGNLAAQAGLASLTTGRKAEVAREAEVGTEPGIVAPPTAVPAASGAALAAADLVRDLAPEVGPGERKIELLKRYLARVRKGAESHVP